MTTRNLLLVLCLACSPACADTITFALDSPTIIAAPGGFITFSGSIQNNGSSLVDLNNISVDISDMSLTVDSSPFFNGPASVAGNSNTGDFDFFNVTIAIPYTDSFGVVSGTITVLGDIEPPDGPDGAQDYLGSENFAVDVEPVSSVPEPSGFVLTLTGAALVLLAGAWRRAGRSAPLRKL
jgi:hypothetical protein